MVSLWSDAAEYLEAVKRSYRRDYWQDQPCYVELWSEKATVLGSMRPITEEFGVMLRPCRGYGSTGMEGQLGRLFENITKPITIFYIEDHDPSGHDIPRDIFRRAQEASGKELEMVRLAIHPEDIQAPFACRRSVSRSRTPVPPHSAEGSENRRPPSNSTRCRSRSCPPRT
jgi:hypothetical protein